MQESKQKHEGESQSAAGGLTKSEDILDRLVVQRLDALLQSIGMSVNPEKASAVVVARLNSYIDEIREVNLIGSQPIGPCLLDTLMQVQREIDSLPPAIRHNTVRNVLEVIGCWEAGDDYSKHVHMSSLSVAGCVSRIVSVIEQSLDNGRCQPTQIDVNFVRQAMAYYLRHNEIVSAATFALRA
jgi:hypothetical protein